MFAPGSMDYEVDRNVTMQPSLEEMTRKAIEILQKNENGFYLFVEGARIGEPGLQLIITPINKNVFILDHAHHNSQARRYVS